MTADTRLFWQSLRDGLLTGSLAFVVGLVIDRVIEGAWPVITTVRVVVTLVVFTFLFGCITYIRRSRTRR